VNFLLERFAESPGSTAFVDRGRTVSYGEVLASIADYERFLETAGVPRKTVVVVLSDYSPDTFCFLMALARRSCVAVPVTPASVVERDVVERLSEATWVAEFTTGVREPRLSETGRNPSNPMLVGFLGLGHAGLILFSSGSTGTPKAILHDLELVATKFQKRGAPIVSIAFLMLDHFGGINTILAITSGLGTVVTIGDRSVAGVCRAVEQHRVEVLPTTPSFLGLLAP
jgi:acyl-CoA synthetase (AMP-forming)/AMP-acid ligase II